MPITPRVQHSPSSTGSISHNGHSNVGPSSSYTAKESLLAPAFGGKPVNPFDGTGLRYDTGISPDLHVNEGKTKVGWEANGNSSLQHSGPRQNIKHEDKEELASSSVLQHAQAFPICFKSSRTRAWEKSRKIDDDQWMLSRDELMAQLRPEEENLVPLNAIAGRVVLYGWQLFANQVEINASLPPLKRRKRIYDDAHEARKQLVKLLVLVQWSKVAPVLQLARNLVAHINDHFTQTDVAITALSETRSILANARLRNYDLVTAIEVLGTGAPQRIPPILKSAIHSTKPFSNVETIQLVQELDEAIRQRLACEEILPLAMTSYTIVDGRASFRVPRLFEADLTLSGSSEEDRWWLLRIKFDFKVTGDGSDRFPRQRRKNQRLNLLTLADVELAPRSVAAVIEEDAAGEQGEGGQKGQGEKGIEVDVEMNEVESHLPLSNDDGTAKRKDAPLVRLYNFLQSQALHYWLDILHYQALQQVRLIWGRRLSVEMKTIRSSRSLHVGYWQRLATDPSLNRTTWLPTAGGNLIISIRERAKETGLEKAMKRLLTTSLEESSEHGRGQIPDRLEIHVEWNVPGPASEHLVTNKFCIDPQDLDAKRFLLEVTSRHAEASIKVIKARLKSSNLERMIIIHNHCRLTAEGYKDHYLHLTLSDKVTIALRVDQMTGQIRLEEEATVGSSATTASSSTWSNHDWIKHLREVSAKVNEKPDQLVSIIQSLQSDVILKDLQEKCTLLGIAVTTRMPLRQVDYTKLRAKAGTLLYIALLQCPSYYLVIHTGQESLQVALLCAGTFLEDLITSMRIVSLEWLDWQRVIFSSSAIKEQTLKKRKREEGQPIRSFSQQELSMLYSYSVALISYHKVEQQLRARGLPYLHVGGWTSLQSPPFEDAAIKSTNEVISRIVPSLCIDSKTIFNASAREMTSRNISIRLQQWWDPSKAHVVIAVKLKLKEGLKVKEDITDTIQEKIHFSAVTNVLSFSFRDIDDCLESFLRIWRHVERILDLSREILSDRQVDFFTLLECDLVKVRFTYSKNLLAEVQWVQEATMQNGGSYRLKLESAPSTATDNDKRNPHQVIKSSLTAWLNKQDDSSSSSSLWHKFLNMLRQTLSILKHVHSFAEEYFDSVNCPELQIQSPCRFRLVFWDKYTLDLRLITGNKVLFSDGTHRDNQENFITKADNTHPTTKDEFSFDETISSSLSSSPSSSSANAIPSLHNILNDLHTQYLQLQIDTSVNTHSSRAAFVLVFRNGLLCPNTSTIIDFFLPRLIKRIQEATE